MSDFERLWDHYFWPMMAVLTALLLMKVMLAAIRGWFGEEE